MRFGAVCCAQDVIDLTRETGFLPLFACGIPGFSVEDCCPPDLWFTEGVDGPWEWKGPVARSGWCLYGKFFRGKAGFVSREWFPDFANFRRDGYDFDARYDDGLASVKDKAVYEALAARGPTLSKDLKRLCGYRKGANTGFDAVITRLQMQAYVCVADFVYPPDRHGVHYGWGVCQYATPEALYGGEWIAGAYERAPAESRARIVAQLSRALPDVPAERLARWIG